MGTIMRPELSEKNKYWIERHRYYELKHFCLQYPIWKKAYVALDGLSNRPLDLVLVSKTNHINNPIEKCIEARLFYSERIDMIEKATKETNLELASYILKGVTIGLSYEHLKVKLAIPCCRDVYYDLYRRFFWLLNKVRL